MPINTGLTMEAGTVSETKTTEAITITEILFL